MCREVCRDVDRCIEECKEKCIEKCTENCVENINRPKLIITMSLSFLIHFHFKSKDIEEEPRKSIKWSKKND